MLWRTKRPSKAAVIRSWLKTSVQWAKSRFEVIVHTDEHPMLASVERGAEGDVPD